MLDLCAAPGGKTMQLAAAGHSVTAVDLSKSRLGRLRENLDRTHLHATLVEADALAGSRTRSSTQFCLTPRARQRAPFADIRRSSTARARKLSRASSKLQRKLLDRAVEWLKPEGSIVYSVCSLEPQEGECVIADFLAGNSISKPSGEARRAPRFATPASQGLGADLARHPRSRRRARRLLHRAACPARLIPSNRLHGRAHHLPFHPVSRLREARRGSARDRCGRRRLDPHRRDGRPFRAQPHDWSGRGEGAAAAQREAVRRPSDDLAGRPFPRRLRRGWRRHHHGPSGSGAAPPSHRPADQGARQESRRVAQPGDAARGARLCARRCSTSCW